QRDKLGLAKTDLERLAERANGKDADELEAALSGLAALPPAASVNLDRWVEQSRRSFAPFLVRGLVRQALGVALRSPEAPSFLPMRWLSKRVLTLAAADLESALRLRPGLAFVYAARSDLAQLLGDETGTEEWLGAGRKACPQCVSLQVSRVLMAGPRFGGSI